MGKYGKALGVWQHTLEGNNGVKIEMELTPKMGDNDKVAKVFSAQAKHKNQSQTLKDIQNLYIEWVQREDNTLTEEDIIELKTLVELNQNKLLEEIMLQFKWTTQEELDKMKDKQGDLLKNLSQTASN